ncbi:MAG: hypothetical protein ACI4DS_03905 [Eubacterium sp.]
MKAKKLLVFVMTAALVFGLNSLTAFGATDLIQYGDFEISEEDWANVVGPVWVIEGIPAYEAGVNETSTNQLQWFEGDSTNYVWDIWSQSGDSAGAKISQTVTVTEAGTYTLSMDIMGGAGDGITVTPFVGDEEGIGTATTGWNADPSTWETITMTVDLEPGDYTVGASVDTSANNAWGKIDNISFVLGGESSDTEKTTEADDDENTTTAAVETTAAVTTAAKTGDATPVAMAAVAIIAAGVVIVSRKKVSE